MAEKQRSILVVELNSKFAYGIFLRLFISSSIYFTFEWIEDYKFHNILTIITNDARVLSTSMHVLLSKKGSSYLNKRLYLNLADLINNEIIARLS